MIRFLCLLLALACGGYAALRTYRLQQYREKIRREKPHRKQQKGLDMLTWALYALAVILLLVFLILCFAGGGSGETETTPSDTVPETTQSVPLFQPTGSAGSDPGNWGITWEVLQNGQTLTDFARGDTISFSGGDEYFSLPGIASFRGGNYRDSATYGTANVAQEILTVNWTSETASLPTSDGSAWTGSGWTGQPLMVKWDEETKQIMNLYADKKAKADLVEVIYATLDGNIYFLDLADGTYTRDPISIGMCFKGSGALDPRGYPLLYVGSGDADADGIKPRMYIISLIDGRILYTGGNDDPDAPRKDNDGWCAFDSSPLVDGETDTLIWPGENGLLYTIKLNTVYDPAAGTIAIAPDAPVVTRYNTSRSGVTDYWYGYEASAVAVEGYLYVSENGGMFYCIDLNTMELVWAQDTEDDSNSSPVFEAEGETGGYLYTAPSLHWTADSDGFGTISICKLDAITGDFVWSKTYDCYTVDGVSGGVQASPLLGKPGSSMEGLILYPIARTPDIGSGLLVALDTRTGSEIWRMEMEHYTWSSPVAVYDDDGTAYVVICDSEGTAFLLDGKTGTVLDTQDVGSLVEASPAVYGNKLVVGTRGQMIYCLKVA